MSEVTVFTPPHPLNTAILFLVFNRLDTTKQVFEAIRQAKPPRLYVAADGARACKEGENEKVQAVREYVMENIDWDCEVKPLFRDENLGCKYAVSRAITWFFENEEQGIILEDDCLPSQSFFWYCERMLDIYSNDDRIMMVTGTNYLLDIRDKVNQEYIFSRHFSIWGWATWKRAWDTYDVELEECTDDFIAKKDFSYLSLNKYVDDAYNNVFKNISKKRVDTWDYQWVFNCIYNYGLCVTPSVNLISNLGVDGAHANGETVNNFLPVLELEPASIKKVKWIVPNMYHELGVSERNYREGYVSRIKRNIKNGLVFFGFYK